MKKIFTLALGLVMGVSAAFAGITTVKNKNEFAAAIAAERTADGCDTVLVKYVDGGINIGSIKNSAGTTCEKGKLVILGESNENEEKPIIMIDWQFSDNEVADNFSLIIENMHLQYRSGAAATSGQIFYVNKFTTHFKEFIIRDCEISNYARTIIRTVPRETTVEDVTTKEYGSFEHFEISDCKIHYSNISSGNTWACIVMGSPMTKCVLKDNLFYDLPYNKQIFSMSYIDKEFADIENTEVIIENNAFFTATQQTNPLFQFDDAIGQMSTYSICNNLFLRPNWTDEYNLEAPVEVKAELDENGDTISTWTEPKQGQIFRCSYGMHTIQNNVICDYYRESAGVDGWAKDVKLDADGEGAWLALDSVNANINPAAAGISWSDFAAPEAKEFYVWNGHALYTMGTNGAPIGPKMMYSETKLDKVTFSVAVEGSKSAVVTYSPQKNQYFKGDVVTVSLDLQGDLNEFLGWSDGNTEMEREITLNEDMALVAQCKEQPYVAVWNFRNNYTKTFDAPIAPNYANLEGCELRMKTWDNVATAYVDSTAKAFQARDNKLSTDTIIHCVMLRSSLMNIDTLGKPDFAYIVVPAVPQASSLTFYAGTDNYCRKNILVDYSLDGETWTNFATVTIAEGGKWTRANVAVPAEVEGKMAYIRVMGDVNSERLHGPEFDELFQEGLADYTWEFLCLADIRLLSSSGTGIESIESDKAAGNNASAIYDLMGRKVVKMVPGQLYIQGGKKFIQK